MTPLQLLIVDDEPLARLRLRSLVDENSGWLVAGEAAKWQVAGEAARWQVAGEAASANEALQWLNRQTLHALLLDIQMPGSSGLQLAQALRSMQNPPAVVFVTAHAEHALQAFELEAVDYLTKPVRRERLAQALQRVESRLQRAAPHAAAAPQAAAAAVLVIHERGRVLRLPVDELLYFRADQKQVTVRTSYDSYVIDDSLADLEVRLAQLAPAGAGFIRVHRNALVALSALRELQLRQTEAGAAPDAIDINEGWAVRVAPLDEWLAVSRRQVGAVKAALSGFVG